MSATPPVSPAGTSQGYSVSVWLSRNKTYVKALISIAFGVITSFLPQIKDTNLSIAAGSAVSLISKMALDWIDFRFSDVPLDQQPPLAAGSVADAVKRQG